MKTIFFFLLSFFVSFDVSAQGQVFPTRLTLTEENPSSYLNLKNSTASPQKYRIELTQFSMKPDGSVSKTDASKNPLTDILKFSPKTVEVAPDGKQVVRVMVTNLENLAEGEYYIHLHFIPEGGAQADTKGKNKFALEARIAVAVPIVVRRGTPVAQGQIKGLSASAIKNGDLEVSFKLLNPSKYFLTGDLDVIAITDKGEVSLSKTTGISSYIPERTVRTLVKKEELTEKAAGSIKKIKVVYASNGDSGAPFELTADSEIGAAKALPKAIKKSASKPR